MAEEQRQWQQARVYFLQALEIDSAFNDAYNRFNDLRSLARLWKASGDRSLPAVVAPILGIRIEETEKLLREILGEE